MVTIRLAELMVGSDGTSAKALWTTTDGLTFETGYFRYAEYDTACVSSQVGCNMGCRFCVTGLQRVIRNLSSEEIVAQVLNDPAEMFTEPRRFKVSFQGMGEPMQNLDAVIGAVREITRCSPRYEFGVSTVGPAHAVQRLTAAAPDIKLQLSVHAPKPRERKALIPGVPSSDLSALIAAGRCHAQASRRRVVVNYLLLDGVNDAVSDAAALLDLLGNDDWYELKVSTFNESENIVLRRSTASSTLAFLSVLEQRGTHVNHFTSMGQDIESGCGQLRSRR